MSNPKGSIRASCGCLLADGDEGEPVYHTDGVCTADGFQPGVTYAWFCTPCAERARSWPQAAATMRYTL